MRNVREFLKHSYWKEVTVEVERAGEQRKNVGGNGDVEENDYRIDVTVGEKNVIISSCKVISGVYVRCAWICGRLICWTSSR